MSSWSYSDAVCGGTPTRAGRPAWLAALFQVDWRNWYAPMYGPAALYRAVVAAALARARAHEERLVVLRVRTGRRDVVGRRGRRCTAHALRCDRARGRGRRGGGLRLELQRARSSAAWSLAWTSRAAASSRASASCPCCCA